MTNYNVYLDDSTEPVLTVRHILIFEWDNESQKLVVVESIHDIKNSSYNFECPYDAEFVAGELNMSVDELLEECINTIYKNVE